MKDETVAREHSHVKLAPRLADIILLTYSPTLTKQNSCFFLM